MGYLIPSLAMQQREQDLDLARRNFDAKIRRRMERRQEEEAVAAARDPDDYDEREPKKKSFDEIKQEIDQMYGDAMMKPSFGEMVFESAKDIGISSIGTYLGFKAMGALSGVKPEPVTAPSAGPVRRAVRPRVSPLRPRTSPSRTRSGRLYRAPQINYQPTPNRFGMAAVYPPPAPPISQRFTSTPNP